MSSTKPVPVSPASVRETLHVSLERRPPVFVGQKCVCSELGDVDPVVEDQVRFEPSVVEKQAAVELGKVVPIFSHVSAPFEAALETANRGGVTHGRIGPNNILVDDSGNAYLADFEITSAARVGATVVAGSAPAVVTPPEFGRGEDLTPASDVYSLAVTVAQAATGRTDALPDLFVGLDGQLAAVLQRATEDEIAAPIR